MDNIFQWLIPRPDELPPIEDLIKDPIFWFSNLLSILLCVSAVVLLHYMMRSGQSHQTLWALVCFCGWLFVAVPILSVCIVNRRWDGFQIIFSCLFIWCRLVGIIMLIYVLLKAKPKKNVIWLPITMLFVPFLLMWCFTLYFFCLIPFLLSFCSCMTLV